VASPFSQQGHIVLISFPHASYRAYQRIGYLNRWSALPGTNFDTAAAVDAGKQVLKEMLQEEGTY
jgi:hypothetical protein